MFEPITAKVRALPPTRVEQAEINAVVEAIKEMKRALTKQEPSVRVSNVPRLFGIALKEFVGKMSSAFPAIMTWCRAVELAGVVLAKASSVSPALPWALALSCPSLRSATATTLFETFVRVADVNGISIDEVLSIAWPQNCIHMNFPPKFRTTKTLLRWVVQITKDGRCVIFCFRLSQVHHPMGRLYIYLHWSHKKLTIQVGKYTIVPLSGPGYGIWCIMFYRTGSHSLKSIYQTGSLWLLGSFSRVHTLVGGHHQPFKRIT